MSGHPCDTGRHYDCPGCPCTCHPRSDQRRCTDECCLDQDPPPEPRDPVPPFSAMRWRPTA